MTTKQLNFRIKRLQEIGSNLLDQLNKGVDKEIAKYYNKSLKGIQYEIAEMYEKYGDNVTFQEMNKYGRLDKLEQAIENRIKDIRIETKKMTTKAITDNFEKQYYYQGYSLESPIGVNMGFGGLPTETIKEAILNPYDRIKWPDRLANHVSMLNQHVREAVTEGLIQGYGYGKTARNVRDQIGRTQSEAQRIIWTETHRARGEARTKAFETSKAAGERLGFKVQRIWDATLDSRTRTSHGYLDGKPAKEYPEGFGWKFSSGVFTTAPSNSGVAKEDIHCRCNDYNQIGDESPEFRRDNEAKKEIPYQTYEEWAKKKDGIKFNGEKFAIK